MMTKVDFEKEIQNITKQIVAKYKPQKIILFGSAAHGKYRQDSDLDFLVIKTNVPKSNIHRRWELRNLIDENLPIDILVLKPEELENRLQKGDPFFETIIRDGKILHG